MINRFCVVLFLSALFFVNNTLCAVTKETSALKTMKAITINDTYMGLSNGPLSNATLEELPKGILMQSGKIIISDKQLSTEIAKEKPEMQQILKDNSFFILEKMSMNLLLNVEARAWAKSIKRDTKKENDAAIIQAYLESLTDKVVISDAETRLFYDGNKDMMGGATYAEVSKDLKTYLHDKKMEELIDGHINSLSTRVPVIINSTWLKSLALKMLDNPVDKARRSGKPAMIDFGADGCRPCEMMTPIIDELKKSYIDQCEILFVHVRQQQILAARYGISSIPVQIFFDKDGKEVYRHTGFFPKDKIVEQLTKLGVR